MNFKFYKKTFYNLLLIFVIGILAKIIQYNILPAKYFYDSKKILNMTLSELSADKAYEFTADFFKCINIFHFDSLLQWSIFIAIIGNIMIFVILLKDKEYTNIQYLFIYASIALLNIYVFNISKDIIQFLIFSFIYIILEKKKTSDTKKIVLITIMLLIEALFFRVYYAVMAMLFITIVFMYNKFIKRKLMEKRSVIKLISIILIAFFIEIMIVGIISKENYDSLLNARFSTNIFRTDDLDAATIIIDPLGYNSNVGIFIGNYIINAIRMMIPIELATKGIKYVAFIIYQLAILYIVIKSLKNISSKNYLYIAVYLAYFMVSVLFEPDFGSWVRHESTIFLILMGLIESTQFTCRNCTTKIKES